MRYRVKIRRELGAVKPEAEKIDGKEYYFEPGWQIDDLRLYSGEVAMLPRDRHYPADAPSWIASGDLVDVESKREGQEL